LFVDPGADLKALRPLRGRAPPEPWHRRLLRRVRRGRRPPKPEVTRSWHGPAPSGMTCGNAFRRPSSYT